MQGFNGMMLCLQKRSIDVVDHVDLTGPIGHRALLQPSITFMHVHARPLYLNEVQVQIGCSRGASLSPKSPNSRYQSRGSNPRVQQTAPSSCSFYFPLQPVVFLLRTYLSSHRETLTDIDCSAAQRSPSRKTPCPFSASKPRSQSIDPKDNSLELNKEVRDNKGRDKVVSRDLRVMTAAHLAASTMRVPRRTLPFTLGASS